MKPESRFKVRNYLYYCIIAVVSMAVLIFAPMLGTDLTMGLKLPQTWGAWIVYVATKALCSLLNVIIFHSFLQQARINVREDPKYREGMDIMYSIEDKDFKPRSPRRWKTQQYLTKGVTIFVSTAFGAVALTNAILSYDYVSMISYILVIVTGIVFGIVSMKNAEEYWTDEFWHYAKNMEDWARMTVVRSDLVKCLHNADINLRKYITKEELDQCLK